MTWDTHSGRSVETVRAELRAIEERQRSVADAALTAHTAHLRREHAAALRARQRELEDELLLTLPEGVEPRPADRPSPGTPGEAG